VGRRRAALDDAEGPTAPSPSVREIQRLVEVPLFEKLLWKEFRAGRTTIVDARDGEIVFEGAGIPPEVAPVELAGSSRPESGRENGRGTWVRRGRAGPRKTDGPATVRLPGHSTLRARSVRLRARSRR